MNEQTETVFPEWFRPWSALCDAGWRDCHLADDEAAAGMYVAALNDLPEYEVMQSVIELVKTEPRFPQPSVFRSEVLRLAEAKRLNVPAIVPPVIRHRVTIGADALAELDDEAIVSRQRFRAETQRLARVNGWPAEQLQRVLDDDAIVGPYEQRARELIAGNVQPMEGIAELFGLIPNGPRRNEVSTESAEHRALVAPAATETPESAPVAEISAHGHSGDSGEAGPDPAMVEQLADRWQADRTSVLPGDLAPEVRAALRQVLEQRRAAV